jgi:hypothetical protein
LYRLSPAGPPLPWPTAPSHLTSPPQTLETWLLLEAPPLLGQSLEMQLLLLLLRCPSCSKQLSWVHAWLLLLCCFDNSSSGSWRLGGESGCSCCLLLLAVPRL